MSSRSRASGMQAWADRSQRSNQTVAETCRTVSISQATQSFAIVLKWGRDECPLGRYGLPAKRSQAEKQWSAS